MRQSGKETRLQSFMREGLAADRREAMALGDQSRNEFGGELGRAALVNPAHGRRYPPGGRG